MKKRFLIFFLGLIFLFFPTMSFGKIVFSEIMYDPAGTDAGYEWVEIYNTSQYAVDLEKYKFCEGKPTCHSWAKDKNNSFEIAGNSYGIITDDFDKFTEKNSFGGLILVSTGFTLTNTGELIQIKNANGTLDDSLTFNPVSGGGGGQTLSVFDGLWKNSENTAGAENIEKQISDGESEGGSGESSESDKKEQINTSYVEISDMYLGKKKLRAEIDEVGVIMAGSRVKFSGTAYGITGVEIKGIEFLWNFGDGSRGEGEFVYHEYDFPHSYIVNLVVKSGNFTGNTKMKISVIEPPLEISDVKTENKETKGYIKLKNNSNEILNIENWMISVDGNRFLIPDNTYIDRNSEAIFPQSITNLNPENNESKKSRVSILFPNGEKFFNYNWGKLQKSIGNLNEEEKGENESLIQKKSILTENVVLVNQKNKKIEIKKTKNKKIVTKKSLKKKKSKKYVLPEGAILYSDYEKSQKTKDGGMSVREMVLKNAKNNVSVNIGGLENKSSSKFFKLSPAENQSANIIYTNSENSIERFLKNNWAFLSFLGILASLIGGGLYMKKKEFDVFMGDDEEKSEMDLLDDVNKELRKKAGEFEIKEMVEK